MTENPGLKSPKFAFQIIYKLGQMGSTTFSELAGEFDRPQSTVHDYIMTLESTGWIVSSGEELQLSTRFLELGHMSRHSIPHFGLAKQRVDELANETGEYVSFCIEENGKCVLVYVAKGEEAVDFGIFQGQRVPLSTTSPGRAILAHMDEQQVSQIVEEVEDEPSPLPRGDLAEELRKIRERGYAFDDESRLEGIRGVAAPIIIDNSVFGALVVGGPATRISGERFQERLPEMVREASNKIEIEATHGNAL
jgi:DNA-binding IclR family transcriptional regulator